MKEVYLFSPSKKGLLGRHSICKKCKAIEASERLMDPEYKARKEAYAKSPERLEWHRQYTAKRRESDEYRANQEKYMEEYRKTYDWRSQRAQSKLDPAFVARQKELRLNRYKKDKANPAKVSAQKEWLDGYRKTEKYREYKRENYRRRVAKKEQSFFIVSSLRNRMNKVLSGHTKAGRSLDLLGCSLDAFKAHLESKFSKGMSWENRGKNGWHIDHIIPCAHFDMNDPTSQRVCFHYLNLQPLWFSENCSKQDALPLGYEALEQKIREAISDLPNKEQSL